MRKKRVKKRRIRGGGARLYAGGFLASRMKDMPVWKTVKRAGGTLYAGGKPLKKKRKIKL